MTTGTSTRSLASTRTLASARALYGTRNPATPIPAPSYPVIISVTSTVLGTTSAQVTVTLDGPAQLYIEYGTTTGYGSETTHETSYNYATHVQTITGLTQNTLYHYRVRTTNSQGNETISGDYTFTTTASASAFFTYGPAITGETLSNLQIGVDSAHKFGYYRFRAEYSGNLTAATVYYLGPPDPGYALGTGGTWNLLLYAAGANGNPTGSALATQAVPARTLTEAVAAFGNEANAKVTFASPYSVTAGTLYCLVFQHTDSTGVNYFSLDCWGCLDGDNAGYSATRFAPKWLNSDFRIGYGSSISGPWTEWPGFLPILDLTIGSNHQGNCYGEASLSLADVGTINGSQNKIRERFTASASKTTTGAAIRLHRLSSTTADLRVALCDASMVELGAFTIAASSVAVGLTPNGVQRTSQGLGSTARWVEGSWSGGNIAITSGTTYNLVFSSTGGTYYAFVNRRLSYGLNNYNAATAFDEGLSEKTSNGGTSWSLLGSATNKHDLQCFLRTTS